MGNIFNEDFRSFLFCLNNHEVKYLLIGGYSVILHGYPRTTGDMDIWVDRTKENYLKISKAFDDFGMPVFDMNEINFLRHPSWDVFTYGRPPVAIDVMVKVKGLDFENSYKNAIIFEDEGLKIKTIHFNDLIIAKKSAGRPKDLDDLQNLGN
jgi:hypothetical protein